MTFPEPNSVADAKPLAAIEAVERGLASQGYIASRQIATAVYLSEQIAKPSTLIKTTLASIPAQVCCVVMRVYAE